MQTAPGTVGNVDDAVVHDRQRIHEYITARASRLIRMAEIINLHASRSAHRVDGPVVRPCSGSSKPDRSARAAASRTSRVVGCSVRTPPVGCDNAGSGDGKIRSGAEVNCPATLSATLRPVTAKHNAATAASTPCAPANPW